MKENQASIPLAIATLLATLGSAAHSPTLLMTLGYPVRAGGCPCVRAVPPPLVPSAPSATTHPGLEVHGPARAWAGNSPTLLMTPGDSVRARGCPCVRAVLLPLAPSAPSATICPGLEVVHGPAHRAWAANSPALLMTLACPVRAGGCPCVRAVPSPLERCARPATTSPGLAVVHGPARRARHCHRTVSAY